MFKTLMIFALMLSLIACQSGGDSKETSFRLDYEKF